MVVVCILFGISLELQGVGEECKYSFDDNFGTNKQMKEDNCKQGLICSHRKCMKKSQLDEQCYDSSYCLSGFCNKNKVCKKIQKVGLNEKCSSVYTTGLEKISCKDRLICTPPDGTESNNVQKFFCQYPKKLYKPCFNWFEENKDLLAP